jgi:site-specific DNA-methyltransferase (adenine-specific)
MSIVDLTKNNINIELGDCMELMDPLAPGSVDALITDTPYGSTALAWDKKIDLEKFWAQAARVVKPNGVVVMFSQQPFTTRLINSNPKQFRYEIVWRKNMPVGFLDSKIRPLRVHENILVFCGQYRGLKNRLRSTYNPQFTAGKPYIRKRSGDRAAHYGSLASQSETVNDGKRYPVDVLDYPNRGGKSYHPTQKPVDLLKWLVLTYTNRGEIVLDPYMGSGSTGVACALTGRAFIGYEREEKYYKISRDRIAMALVGEVA